MFIGGAFTINTNQAQNIARFSLATPNSPTFSPMSSSTGEYGVNGKVNCIALDTASNTLLFGGLFDNTVGGNSQPFSFGNLCTIENPTQSNGSQVFDAYYDQQLQNIFITDGEVYSMCCVGINVFIGGNFQYTGYSTLQYHYCSCFSLNWVNTPPYEPFIRCGLSNSWNQPVYNLAVSAINPSYVVATGAFSFTESSVPINYGCYINAVSPSTTALQPIVATPALTTCNLTGLLDTRGGQDIITTAANQVYKSSSGQTWVNQDLSIAPSTPPKTPSGISYNSGTSFASYSNNPFVRYF